MTHRSEMLESVADFPANGPAYWLRPARYTAITPTNGVSVALSKDARSCVVFIGSQEGGEGTARIKPFGTAFLFKGGKLLNGGSYLVTARHVAEKLDAPYVIRLNKKGGGAQVFPVERAEDIKWHYHDDETVDLAVTPFTAPDWADVSYFSADHSLREFKLESKRISAGDAAYVIGLFHLLHGTEENLPVVHTGHIAMLPGKERIPVNGTDVEGYLVQANAISGCSGSPVFAQRTLAVKIPPEMLNKKYHEDTSPLNADVGGSLWLLGVWQSSWKVKGSQIVSVKTDADGFDGTMAPLGMGVIVPTTKLLELLEKQELSMARENLRKTSAELSATQDSINLHITGDQILKNMMRMSPAPRSKPKGKTKGKRPA